MGFKINSRSHKESKTKLEVYKKKTEDMGMKKASQKVMKFGEYKELDEVCIFG